MVASTSVPLSKTSQAAFIAYYRSVQANLNTERSSMRSRFETIDRAYQREQDQTEEHQRAKNANTSGDPNRFQNITVPVVMPQVEAAVTYQSSVYLTGSPLFGTVASPKFMDEALQIESVIENDSLKGGWARELMLFFRDGFKYNYAPLEVDWTDEITYTVATNIEASLTKGIPKEVVWSGNRVRRLDPYNTFVDPRVPPTEVYKRGEYAGYTDYLSRIELKSYIASLPDQIIANIKPAFESGLGARNSGAASDSSSFYIPSINPDVDGEDAKQVGTNWLSWAGLSATRNKNIDYKDTYERTILYAKVLPSEFELRVPNSNTPQIYKLVIINHEHIIYCEQQTNAHAYLPILIGQPLEDGLGYQTKSLASNGVPFQQLTSTYMNSIVASRRRAISDRVLYDPSRIASSHINSANPSAKIPVRPAAYGKNLSESVYQFPYREDQATASMQQVSTLLGLANSLSGQNQAQQGQFVKGNKTLHEFESVMQNANGRDQLASILLEHQVFTPLKLILKLNILQFHGGGTIYNRDKQVEVEIDPVKLRTAVLEFRVSDGLTPASKLLNTDSYATALQVLGSSPQIANGYNVAPLFSYFMKTQGAKISEFEKSPEQLAYEQALNSWQSIMQLAIEKGIDPETLGAGEQPTPEQFGYDPKANNPAPAEATSSDEQQQAQGTLI